jgi:hypothetical protein
MAPGESEEEDLCDVGNDVFGVEEMVGVVDAGAAVPGDEDMLAADGDADADDVDIDADVDADVDEGEGGDVMEVVRVYSKSTRQREFMLSERHAT